MKKLVLAALSLVLLCTTSACSKKEETKDLLTQVKERGTIIIATEGDWSPWTYHDETTGELTGYDVEIGKRIAEIMGVEAEFKETTWDSILAGVEAGTFDIACNGVGYTEERSKTFSFCEPYYYTSKVLIVSADNTDITSWEDLNGKTTGNTISSTYAAVAESYGATVTGVDDFVQTIELLARGDIDATINAKESYLDYIAQHPEANIKVVAEADGDIVAFPVAKNDNTATFVEAVNDALQQMRDSGELAEISIRFFGSDHTTSAE